MASGSHHTSSSVQQVPHTDIEPQLKDVLSFVDGHVRFAETKNAALFAANVALTIGVVRVLRDGVVVPSLARYYLWILSVAAILAAAVSLLSFLPSTKVPWIGHSSRKAHVGNLLFFGDVQNLDANHYLAALARSCGAQMEIPTEWERMYAEQIIANAKIAFRKFAYFKVALWITLCGALTPLLAAALFLWASDNEL